MSVTALNGTLTTFSTSLYEVKWTTTFTTGMYLYINYTKGTETSLDLTFKAVDNTVSLSAGEYFITKIAPTTYIVEKFIVKLDGTIPRIVVPVPVPDSADYLITQFTYIGTPSGTVTVFGATDNKYKSI
jgi:hypothetical protein